jgi:hypothetical protein
MCNPEVVEVVNEFLELYRDVYIDVLIKTGLDWTK